MTTVNFDTAVEALIEACEGTPGFDEQVERALLIREVRGRLRLVLGTGSSSELREIADRIERKLNQLLGGWFYGPVLTTADEQGRRKLALQLVNGATDPWPMGWPSERIVNPLSGERRPLPGERWAAQQALLSKSPWLTGLAQDDPPWPMLDQTPRVTAFYSFKGGVGRSTTLGVLAVMLARRGQRVVAVDLDLEAPGLTPLLLDPDAPPPPQSVVDYLLAETATGARPEELPILPVDLAGIRLDLVPAGQLTAGYLNRLARLDTVGRQPGPSKSPVYRSLKGLLKRIKQEHNPDHILIDCRTGLNDLGGVVLADLAHVDVIVGRDEPADLDGLRLVLEALNRRRTGAAARRLATVQAFLMDPPSSDGGRATHAAHREAQYQVFSEHWYDEDDLPEPLDDDAPHHPHPILFNDTLARARWLGSEALPASFWERADYSAILDRLDALWAAEPPSEEPP